METIGMTEFKIFTGLLKASKSPDGKMRLHGIASSTTKDLHGDVMTASAIDDMERAANNNLTIFLNHSYNVPEDVGGSVEHARSMTRGVDQDGNPNIDLSFDVLMNDTNPRAVSTWEAIDRGTKLGLSIGAMIPEGGAKRNKDGTYLIEHVDLLETSIVGIPANPRSWVEYAVKAIRAKGKDDRTATVPLGAPTLTLNNNDYTITGTLDSTNVIFDSITISDNVPTVVTPVVIDAATCPTCGKPKGAGGCDDSFHKDVEPDIQDTSVTIIQIDTSDEAGSDAPGSSQEAEQVSEPEAEVGLLDETADGDDEALGDTVTSSVDITRTLGETLNLLRETTRELVDARKALAEAEAMKSAMEIERNLMKTERDHVLIQTKELLDRVANSPLVRRAVVTDVQRDFRSRFEGIYSDSFLEMLERNTDG